MARKDGLHPGVIGTIVFVAILAGLSVLGTIFFEGGDLGSDVGGFTAGFLIVLVLGLLVGLFYYVGKRSAGRRR